MHKIQFRSSFKALLRIKKLFKFINFNQEITYQSPHPSILLLTGWVNFDWSGNYELIIYVIILSYYVFVFAWLYKKTAPFKTFKYS